VLSGAMNAVNRAEAGAIGVLPKSQQSAFIKALQTYAEALDKMEGGAPAKKAAKKKAARKAPAKKKKAKKAKRGRR